MEEGTSLGKWQYYIFNIHYSYNSELPEPVELLNLIRLKKYIDSTCLKHKITEENWKKPFRYSFICFTQGKFPNSVTFQVVQYMKLINPEHYARSVPQ